MSINPIPDKLKGFRLYDAQSQDQLGVTDITLPSIELQTDTVSGAGVAGEIDMPVAGLVKSMTMSMKWRMATARVTSLAAMKAHHLDARGAAQIYDAGAGELKTEAIKLVVQAVPKKISLGKFESGKLMDTETEFEVISLRLFIGGVQKLHIDKLNEIFEVDGVDHLAADRQVLGLTG